MTIPIGTAEYSANATRVKTRAVSYSADELNDSKAILAQTLWDQQALDEFEALAQSVGSTGFDANAVRIIFLASPDPEPWRAGEVLAELYSNAHLKIALPWHAQWDLKNESASLSGADLVGFHVSGDTVVFAFGEVKTSSDVASPPTVMSGRSGLRRQLKTLRDNDLRKWILVKYLHRRAMGSSWEDQYKKAYREFTSSNYRRIALLGFLVRDVPPNPQDFETESSTLNADCPDETSIILQALYLPAASIGQLVSEAKLLRDQE